MEEEKKKEEFPQLAFLKERRKKFDMPEGHKHLIAPQTRGND